jgi:AcrR family transcriptional regulator
MTTVRAEIGKEKRARTRAALVEAAMRVFARLGPEAPTIEDFIAEAGVARGTFYNYFETREDLLVAVATVVSEQLLAAMAVLRRLPDPADRLGCSVRTFVRKAASDPTWGWVIVRIALVAAPIGKSMRAYLAADIKDGLAAGRFRSPSRQAAYDLVLGTGLMAMRSVLRGEADADHAEDAAQVVLTALGVPDAAEVAYRSMDAHMLAARASRGGNGRAARPPAARKTVGRRGLG